MRCANCNDDLLPPEETLIGVIQVCPICRAIYLIDSGVEIKTRRDWRDRDPGIMLDPDISDSIGLNSTDATPI